MQQPIKIDPKGIIPTDAFLDLFAKPSQQVKNKYKLEMNFCDGHKPQIKLGEPCTIKVDDIEIEAVFTGWEEGWAIFAAYIEPEKMAKLRGANG